MISADIDNSGMIAMMTGVEIPESERYLGNTNSKRMACKMYIPKVLPPSRANSSVKDDDGTPLNIFLNNKRKLIAPDSPSSSLKTYTCSLMMVSFSVSSRRNKITGKERCS